MMGTTVEMSPSALFDRVQEQLGIGEAEVDESYQSWRVKQIGLLKRLMKYRGLSADDVLLCVDYCKAHRVQPETYPWLLSVYGEARYWDRKRVQSGSKEQLEVEKAIFFEHTLADDDSLYWLERLTRASDAGEVLREWKVARGV